MRAITKGPEPASLTAHRQTPHGDYSNYEAKDDLRYALVTEQRGLAVTAWVASIPSARP